MLSSTLKIVWFCKCGRQLTETEHHFYGNECSDCVYRRLSQLAEEAKVKKDDSAQEEHRRPTSLPEQPAQ